MPLAVVLILLVVGSLVFHFLSPWTFTPLASNWGQIDFTIDVTFVVTGFVFVAVNLFMAWCVIRYRARAGSKANYDPENQKLEWILTVVTTIGVAAMLAPGLWVWAKFVDVPDEALQLEAVGQQWHWSYRLPGDDGEFGNVATRFMSEDNPFGMDPDDPLGQDDILISDAEVHLPVGEPVRFNLRSKDVLHNFTVAQFRVKMDLVPGMETHMWLTPTVKGRYEVLCEELCGVAHYAMRGAVIVEDRPDYESWVANHPTFAETQAASPGNVQAGKARYTVCASCHGQNAEGMQALNGPKLAGQSEWYMRAEIAAFQDGLRGYHDDDTYGKQMVPMANTLASEAAVNNVIAYMQSLPDEPAPATIEGNTANGERIYRRLLLLPRQRGRGPPRHECTAARRHDRLVHRAATREFPRRRAWRAPAGLLRQADGLHGARPAGRAGGQRRGRLHQLALAREARRGRRNTTSRGSARWLTLQSPIVTDEMRTSRSADIHHQIHLEPGPQGHRHPVRHHRHLRRPGCAGPVGADAPAAGFPDALRASSTRQLLPGQ
ncbi:MAG: cytochrome c oxidase subunit II [Woeseiaceae bacterium]|nr:cytochrome c oxidase subunit II [Woeseiaceae bacterium]